MWEQEKDFIVKEMHQLESIRAQQILRRMEQSDKDEQDRQFNSNCLQSKGFGSARSSARQHGTTSNGVSFSEPNRFRSVKSAPERRVRSLAEDYAREQNKSSVSIRAGNRASRDFQWNSSTRLLPTKYVPLLPDFYPRDEYTTKPKYPLKKGGGPVPNIHAIPVKYETTNLSANLRRPALPPTVIETFFRDHPAESQPTFYKAANVSDLPKRKRCDSKGLNKATVAAHLSDDLKSMTVKAALGLS